jgi:hypothetical protein
MAVVGKTTYKLLKFEGNIGRGGEIRTPGLCLPNPDLGC